MSVWMHNHPHQQGAQAKAPGSQQQITHIDCHLPKPIQSGKSGPKFMHVCQLVQPERLASTTCNGSRASCRNREDNTNRGRGGGGGGGGWGGGRCSRWARTPGCL